MSDLVVVTGVSGFLASHVAAQLLDGGYRVRGTVRDSTRGENTRRAIEQAAASRRGADADGGTSRPAPGAGSDPVELVSADLSSDSGWQEAMADASAVIHCASPFPLNNPKDEDELIAPAREGTLRVLRAAAEAGVARVVLTSSIAAMIGGHRAVPKPIGPHHWTDVAAADVTAYTKSKTLAEQAAWEFIDGTTGAPELVAINPGAIIGPVITPRLGTSNRMVEQILAGALPAVPRVGFACVDVRDTAAAHISALTSSGAPGGRFPVTTGFLWLRDVALILAKRYPDRRLPTKEMSDRLVRLLGPFNEAVRAVVPDLGIRVDINATSTMEILNWRPRPLMSTVIETAESLQANSLLSG